MTRATRPAWLAWFVAVVLCAPVTGWAHAASDSYLTLDVDGATVTGRWDIALRDLDYVIGLDADGDRRLTWGEVRSRGQEIERYALGRLALRGDAGNCPVAVTEWLVDRHADGAYLVLRLAGRCGGPVASFAVTYRLLFDADTSHRGLLNLGLGDRRVTAVFAPDAQTQRFAGHGSWQAFTTFVASGVEHILGGYDHLLFLCSLLLPAVLVRRQSAWRPAPDARPVALDVLRTVTAFTAAHTLTFMLAAYGTVDLPSRFVEAAIAASVVVAALNNVFALVASRRWTAAFAFGLVHGFGFASVLTGLQLPAGPGRVVPLLGFNLGVELGQLAVVALALPVLFALRATTFYRRAVLVGGSCAIALVAGGWFVERAFGWTLPAISCCTGLAALR